MSTIYFFYPKEVGPDFNPIDLSSGLDCWIMQTFQKLNDVTQDIELSLVSEIPDEGIIVFHKGFFPRLLKPNSQQLFVCIQADYGRHKYAQVHVVQNPLGKARLNFSRRAYFERFVFNFSKNYFISHWNQPGILRRDESRLKELRNLFYFGAIQNLPASLRSDSFKEQLKNKGIIFHVITNPTAWNDYSDADCVLSIRDFEQKEHYHKPFSKIINSLLAGVPVISGYESGVNFLNKQLHLQIPVASNQHQLEAIITAMKNNYPQALDNVHQMQQKITAFCDDAILQDWVLLFDRLNSVYAHWRPANPIVKKAYFLFRS